MDTPSRCWLKNLSNRHNS
ncbi:YsgD/CorL family protein [Franconibacter helveticus 513]